MVFVLDDGTSNAHSSAFMGLAAWADNIFTVSSCLEHAAVQVHELNGTLGRLGMRAKPSSLQVLANSWALKAAGTHEANIYTSLVPG
eukprot:6594383-Karenia_brevis.AAC.1